MRIRLGQPADAPALAQIAQAAYAKYLPRMKRAPAPMNADFAAHCRRDLVYVCAGETGDLLGYAVLLRKGETPLLDNIAVLPQAQGQGIGARLLAQVEADLAAAGDAAYSLYTNEAMHENLGWYQRHGFVETHRRTEDGYRRVYLRKQLAASG